jgi:DNA polymerase-3 subunit epsilon
VKNLSDSNGNITLTKLVAYTQNTEGIDQERDIFCCVLDIETTHLKPEQGEIIQIAILPFFCNKHTGEITGIFNALVRYQEPSEPLSEEIKNLTGLTDDILKNQSINWEGVVKLLEKFSLIIAHNATFDQTWLDHTLKSVGKKIPETHWACSMKDCEWPSNLYPSKNLEVLCAWNGFWFDSHNAENDVHALLHLIQKKSLMPILMSTASRTLFRVYAFGSKFEENTLLKDRQYSWDTKARCWFTNVSEDTLENEQNWLYNTLSSVKPEVVKLNLSQRFLQ